MSTIRTTFIQHPSATEPAIELEADGTVLIPSIPEPDLTNLDADNLTSGTVPTARVSGSYTGITGTGALNAGSIASGFGAVNIGTSTFTGNGSGLTTLNATNLSSGTVNKARLPAGTIIDVKSAVFTGTQSASVVARGNLAVSGLSITHSVASASNRLIISGTIGVAGSDVQSATVGIAISDGTNLLAIGNAASNRTRVSAGGEPVGGAVDTIITTLLHFSFVHTPGAGSKTYTVRAINIRDTTNTLFINRSQSDGDSSRRSRGASTLIIQEVAS